MVTSLSAVFSLGSLLILAYHHGRKGKESDPQIADTGSGMTPDQLKKLRELYFSTKEGTGTGLGMMVVSRIFESMDGTIRAESKVNKGT
ncbi:hypothetical protein GCM10009865_53370 [Aeromicrobium ponti]|uniref:histidine kinase n=1 Tax=Cytobacillus oceanisediminis TaxID=665099 RepID=A0A562J4Y3_9BACI|nr:ATP-binding protein [Cytobacillus oceanisediminis]TWH78240.1 histidine kinase/DNA gyrase B/HSP90-like ATPase [Cytobacillus oceanisediminis]